MEDKKIRGKVAQILNEREVVINIGKDAGVKIGMKFKILANYGPRNRRATGID
jgi:hypothetical protein